MDPIASRIMLLVMTLTHNFSQPYPGPPVRPPFVRIVTNAPEPPFEWSRAEKKQFIAKLQTFKRGDKIEDVVKLLGPPYDSDLIMPKESENARGTRSSYYLKKKEKNGSNEIYDQDVDLVFDLNNRLTEILTNIKGLNVGNLVTINTQGSELENLEKP